MLAKGARPHKTEHSNLEKRSEISKENENYGFDWLPGQMEARPYVSSENIFWKHHHLSTHT